MNIVFMRWCVSVCFEMPSHCVLPRTAFSFQSYFSFLYTDITWTTVCSMYSYDTNLILTIITVFLWLSYIFPASRKPWGFKLEWSLAVSHVLVGCHKQTFAFIMHLLSICCTLETAPVFYDKAKIPAPTEFMFSLFASWVPCPKAASPSHS